MSFPTSSVLDTLQTGSLIGSWTTPSLGQSQNVVADGTGARSGSGAGAGAYWNPTTFGANQEMYVTVATSNGLIALLTRITNPGTTTAASLNAYQLNVVFAGSWALYKWVTGTATQINSGTMTAIANGDSVGLEANGTSITFYAKYGAGAWTSVAATTDSAVSGAGYVGFLPTNTAVRLTNAGGGAISTGNTGGFLAFT